ncbi:MAG: rod shape-determining protein MreD [Chloroflexota bacterium]
MSLTLAAVGAVAAALLQSTIVPYLDIGGARPDLVLIYAVIVTVVVGTDHGLAAALFGGIIIDALAPRPFGSTVFVLLVAIGGAAVIARLPARGRAFSTVLAVLLMSLLGPLVFSVVYGALRGPLAVANPLGSIVPDALYATAIAALAGPAAVHAHTRFFEKERIDW